MEYNYDIFKSNVFNAIKEYKLKKGENWSPDFLAFNECAMSLARNELLYTQDGKVLYYGILVVKFCEPSNYPMVWVLDKPKYIEKQVY